MIGRDILQQLGHLLRPLRMQISNLVARGVVQVVGDGSKLQSVQIGVLDGEDIDDGERFQEYGFSSVPLAGAEAVVVFPSGDHGHPLVVAVDDRRYRPTGLDPGEVAIYHKDGARIHLKANGDIVVSAKPGGEVFIDDGAGGAEPMITKSQFDAHVHPTGTGPSGTPNNAATSGTTVVRGK